MKYLWKVRKNQNGAQLTHYGILGMKWGVRRTPEQLGHKTVVSGRKLKYTSPSAEKVKQTGKWVAKEFVARLVPGAGLLMNANVINNWRKQYDIKDYGKGSEKLTELKKKPEGTSNSMMEDVKAVNKTGKKGYVFNCLNCTVALEMRQRGYDVEALPRSVGESIGAYKKYFSNVPIYSASTTREQGESRKDWVNKSYNNLCSELEKNPDGSRGFVSFSYEGTTSGHTISWEVSNGNVEFYDSQSGTRGADKLMSLSNQDYMYARLDNAKLDSSVTEVVGSRGKKR